jgi:cobyrinic acid a,c-diamide synthase
MLSKEAILTTLYRASIGADIVLIDGHGGLFDAELAGSVKGSDCEIAKNTLTPIIIVVDATKFGTSAAALIGGFTIGMKDIPVSAIMNRTTAKRDYLFYAAAAERFGLVAPLGAVPNIEDYAAFPSSVVSEVGSRSHLARQSLANLASIFRSAVDLDQLITYAKGAPNVAVSMPSFVPKSRRYRIAVSADSCFFMQYHDNLDLLRYFGAEIVPFSPLADRSLPSRTKGVYICGGRMKDYGSNLANNVLGKSSIKSFIDEGGILYSEGAGTAYLSKTFTVDGITYEGVGILDGDAVLDSAQVEPSVCVASAIYPHLLGDVGCELLGIHSKEWHYKVDPACAVMLECKMKNGSPSFYEGYAVNGRHLSTFGFFHWGSTLWAPRLFVEVISQKGD